MRIKKILAISILIIFAFCGIFSDFIANDHPIIAQYNRNIIVTPFYRNQHTDELIPVLQPLIRYSYHHIDTNNTGTVSPFAHQNLHDNQQRHYLGTDIYGRDILAGLIHGSSIALLVGFGSMLLALFLGLIMSLIPSYIGDKGFKTSYSKIFIFLITLFTVIYISYYRKFIFSNFSITYFLLSLLSFLLIINFINIFKSKKQITIPLDTLNTIFTSMFLSIPGSFIILVLINLFTPASILNIIILIGIMKWPVFSRHIRAEVLKVKKERYIESSKVLGLKESYIITIHIIPQILTPLLVAFSYGFVSTILLESTLSFLGIGIPVDHISWGSILGEARNNISAWWLALFPGLFISTVIISINYLAGIASKSIYGNQNI